MTDYETSSNLFLLHVEVLNDDTNEEVQGEECAEDDEKDVVQVNSDPDFKQGLVPFLER